MEFTVYDNPKENGIDLEIDMENGMFIKVLIGDQQAYELIRIIQNKINSRVDFLG